MSILEFDDGIGGRLRGTLHAPGATPGDVLTVGATRGAISPSPGGGLQPGIAFADYLFTEGDTAGTYTARHPLPAGTTVLDLLAYNFAGWEATFAGTALLSVSDTANGTAYFNGVGWGGTYDPGVEPTLAAGAFSLTVGSTFSTAAYGQGGTPNPGVGAFYAAADELVMEIVTTLPAEPDPGFGITLLRVLYLPPQVATPATFA